MTRYLLHDHAWYMWTGPVLLLILWTWAYFKFRVLVRPPNVLHYDDRKLPLENGAYFMPWAHHVVSLSPRTLIVGPHELIPQAETVTTRRGVRNDWERLTQLGASKVKPIVIIWRPSPRGLSYFCALPYPAGTHVEELLRDILLAHPDTDIKVYVYQMNLGIEILSITGQGKKKDAGSVSLADGVDIPYEG